MNEIWKPIPEFPGYEVSNLGQVRSWKIRGRTTRPVTKPRLLTQTPRNSNRKYLSVKLYRDDIGHTFSVHRLVLEAFVGPMPAGQEVRHLNGDETNNSLTNLAYGTHEENIADQRAHGTMVRLNGESHGGSVLTDSDVLEIRRIYAAGEMNQYQLAEKFGVHQTNISLIVRRKKWTHL